MDEWQVSVNVDGDGRYGRIDFGKKECPDWLNEDIHWLAPEGDQPGTWKSKRQIVTFNPPLVAGQRDQRAVMTCVDSVSCRTLRIQEAKKAQEVAA